MMLNSSDSIQDVVKLLREIRDPAEKAALIAELVLSELPDVIALTARKCVILHWFDQFTITALLQDDHLTPDEIRNVYEQIISLPFIETLPWGFAIQNLTREGLLKRYISTQPTLLKSTAHLAARGYEVSDNETIAAEALFCYVIAGDQVASEKLLDRLTKRALGRGDTHYIENLQGLLEEATRFPFIESGINVANGIRKVLEGLQNDEGEKETALSKGQQSVQVQNKSAHSDRFPPVWNVPYRYAFFFTGRDRLIEQLLTNFVSKHDSGTIPIQALTGLGGLGKTQTAVAYAYRYRKQYQTVLWVRANTEEDLVAHFKIMAELLKRPTAHLKQRESLLASMQEWFRNTTDWLLILDNADNLAMVEPFLPKATGGHLLLTTRALAVGALAQPLALTPLTPDDGALCILRRANSIPWSGQLSDASKASVKAAQELSQLMDGLPLALEQVGAYIETTGRSVSGYLDLYRRYRPEIQHVQHGVVPNYREPVAFAWNIAREMVKQENAAAIELLCLCAYLSPDAIPYELFTQGAHVLGPTLGPVAAHEIPLDRAIALLRKHSLIKNEVDRNTDLSRLIIHPVLQEVLKDGMDPQTQRLWAERAVHVVALALPFVEWQIMQAHVRSCIPLIEHWKMSFHEADLIRQRSAAEHTQRRRHMPTSHVPTLWNIPYQRNPFFTGREDVLTQLYQTLHTESTVALSHPQGINGLGGIGKTQTALEYAYRYRTDYNTVLWVRADSVTSLTSSLVELARVLELPERYEQDQEIIVQAVLRWFRLHTDWLLIYDNIDDLSMAEPFLPKAGPGHLLLTTRAHALGGLAERLDIQKMEPEIGALLLLRRATILPIKALLNMATSDDQSIAHAISQKLDGLPLALDQAGAYIKETPCSLSEYLSLYQTRRSDILRKRGSFDQDYPASVATTWSLSFEKVSQANPASAELLDFCAFLAPDPIPETLITKGAQHLPPILQKAVVHPLQFDRVISTLLAYSLLHREIGNTTVSVHRLVQAVLKDQMDEQSRRQWAQRDVRAVNAAFPEVEFETWPQCDRLLPHALLCADLIAQEQMTFLEATRLLNQTGYYLHERARYVEAEPLYMRALEIREQQVGPQHPDTAQVLNNLALLYYTQDKYKQAEPLYLRALAIDKKVHGADHYEVATDLNNLAGLYRAQRKYEQAEPLYQRALAIREQQLGAQHPSIARSLNNLALFYKTQDKYEQAESLYQRALVIWEQQLGPEHPDTATSLNNLALLYNTQGKYEQAEPLYQRALAIDEKVYGADHHAVATDLNNLSLLYYDQGKYEQAEPLLKRALAIREQRLGPQHPDTAQSRNNLAKLYHNQGKNTQAEPLLRRTLSITEQQLGPDHPDTALSLNNLASLYQDQGKDEQAEPLYLRALSIDEGALGPQHPTTQRIRANYARLLRTMGRDAEAAALDQP